VNRADSISYPLQKLLFRPLVVVVGCLLLAPEQLSALELNRYFSSDMVLQRDQPLKVWGTAKKGDTITVTVADQTVEATADGEGKWVATFNPMPASSEGREVVATSSVGNQKSGIGNVLVGDVFLFARQSSIDVSLGSTPEGKTAAAGIKGANAFLKGVRPFLRHEETLV